MSNSVTDLSTSFKCSYVCRRGDEAIKVLFLCNYCHVNKILGHSMVSSYK